MHARRIAAALAGVLALGTLAATMTAAEAADPVPGGTIGGPLHAEMYPSGLETAPDGTVVIADTGNNRVAKYAASGSLIWQIGTHGAGTNEFDNPRDVGVDDAGNIYVADTRNSRIVKLSSSGAWLGSTTGPATAFSFPLGVSAKGSKVYVGDTGRHRVVVLDQSLAVLQTVVANGVCANINDNRDAQADSAGNIYVAGYKTNEIVKFAPNGTCIGKWGGTGTANGKFRTPYGVATATDPVTGEELLYVADGLNNRVQVFTLTGTFVAAFGGYGEPGQAGTFTTMRRVAVDSAGNAWAADLWGNRIERWDRTPTGFTYDRTIGAVMPDPTDTAVFHEPRGMDFAPDGDLWVSDTVHHQFVRFDADGDIVDTCGERAAEGTQLGQFNWPRGIAVDPATGNLWVADTKQHQLQVLNESCEGIGFVKDKPAGADTRSFNWPYDIAIRSSDRFAFVVDTQNHRIKAYDVANAVFPADNKGPLPAFTFGTRGTGPNNFRWPSAVAVGPNGNVYVADRGNNRIQEFTFTAAGGFSNPRTWNAGGTLDQPEGVAVDSTGRVVVADSADDQMVVMAADRSVEATVSGLHHPSAVEIGAGGTIYLADTYADVIRTYTIPVAPPPDTIAPVASFSSPAANAQVPVGAITITGTATDNQSVAAVYVALRRNDTQQWLRANGTYGTGLVWVPATVASPGATSSGWSFSTALPVTGGYFAQVRVDDGAGNQNAAPKPGRSFTAVTAGDTATPTGTITAPTAGAQVTSPVTITGTASDDKGVASVKLGIKHNVTGLWWNGTAWQAAAVKVTATLNSPGAASTTWSYTLTGGGTGSQGFSTDITDTAGKLATGTGKPAWRNFTVVP
ncbi:Ig-like domain-containing protein [Nocardioides sp. SR21]|uniref:Ig-like domain-containing protein n=1 Tax=Nocardioides sp. SR21 TaxID=2919501 RepID=UPI001FAAC70F|nr:Ig-like domain-containing protein [Nocardioides sp. SR21]